MSLDRFWNKVDATGPCWLWTACTSGNGYGGFQLDGRLQAAHRVAYELLVGPIPEGMQLDHLCRVLICVNPDHLEVVTCRENLMRSPIAPASVNSRRVRCVHGHELSGANLRMSNGKRQCRACERSHA
jgi:hypothetical protein